MRLSNEIYRGHNTTLHAGIPPIAGLGRHSILQKLRSDFNRENSPAIGARLQDREIGNWKDQLPFGVCKLRYTLDRSLGS